MNCFWRQRSGWLAFASALWLGWSRMVAAGAESPAPPRLLWETTITSHSDYSPALGPAGDLYFGTFDGDLWAVTPEGKRASLRGQELIYDGPVISADGIIMFLFAHGQIQGCYHERSLTSQWSAGIAYAGLASPTIATGRFYVLANRLLRAYEWDSSLDGSAWPKFRGDARNTGNQAFSPPTP